MVCVLKLMNFSVLSVVQWWILKLTWFQNLGYYNDKFIFWRSLKMPIYEYVCEKCNKHFEIMQKITDESLTTCSDCKGHLKKMISSTSFVLKGTGWYATDYASEQG